MRPGLLLVLSMMACADKPAETPKPVDPTPVAPSPSVTKDIEPVPAAPPPASDNPPGEKVCRTEKSNGSATEVFLTWDGNEATGTLREYAPSGMVHDRRVKAERANNIVIIDDIREHDLATHLAVVATKDGKKLMRLDDQWSPCK